MSRQATSYLLLFTMLAESISAYIFAAVIERRRRIASPFSTEWLVCVDILEISDVRSSKGLFVTSC